MCFGSAEGCAACCIAVTRSTSIGSESYPFRSSTVVSSSNKRLYHMYIYRGSCLVYLLCIALLDKAYQWCVCAKENDEEDVWRRLILAG